MSKHSFNQEADNACIAKWRELIVRFNELTENSPSPGSIQKQLLQLKEDASIAGALTARQSDAIISRIKCYMENRYGRTKEHVNFQAA